MNENAHGPWTASSGGADEDFSSFLDFNDVDLTFAEGGSAPGPNNVHEDAMDVGNEDFAQELDTSQLSTPISATYAPGETLTDVSIQQQLFQQQLHHRAAHHQTSARPPNFNDQQAQRNPYFRHGMVPPTPNSVEMHGAQVHAFTDPQALGMYESGKGHDQMVFTPLVSPAFQLHEFGAPGEYFSPLTSPALQAQDYTGGAHSVGSLKEIDRRENTNTSSNSSSTTRKPKRRSTATSKDPVHAVRSSPAMKPRQKRQSGGGKTTKEVAEIVSGLGVMQRNSPGLGAASAMISKASSETGSISPEPLSEVLMPPPAAPRSGSHGKSNHSSPRDASLNPIGCNAPATPASLFRSQRPEPALTDQTARQAPRSQSNETHSGKPSAPSTPYMLAQDVVSHSSSTSVSKSACDTLGSPVGGPILGSSRADASTAGPSVQAFSAAARDGAQQRSVKKRSSSSHVSPALRPRISPSIKPLLPGVAAYDSETTAALLANKSNYERIIDGSASQLGVNFPAQLSENLTSKRTSHKLAEQGRRNRINTALAEIQALLPEDFRKDGLEQSISAMPSPSGHSGASKAKTVENAIEFIKSLKLELTEAKSELAAVKTLMAAAEAENAELKAKMINQ